jgi:hypothetical protein
MADERSPLTTTDAGIPASSDEHSLTAGPNGPILLRDLDCHLRDLHNSIAEGEAPEWPPHRQIMPFRDAAEYRFNPLGLTKVRSYTDYPRVPIGRMVLNRNPEQRKLLLSQVLEDSVREGKTRQRFERFLLLLVSLYLLVSLLGFGLLRQQAISPSEVRMDNSSSSQQLGSGERVESPR